MMYSGDDYYGDDVTSPLYQPTRRTAMKNFTVYAVFPSGTEKVIGSFEFRDQAIKAIERFLNMRPSATCYINKETVGWVK